MLCDKDVASIIVCLSLPLDWSRSYVLACWVDVCGSNLEGMCFTRKTVLWWEWTWFLFPFLPLLFSLVSDWHFVDVSFYKTACLVDACGLRWSETLIKLIWWVIQCSEFIWCGIYPYFQYLSYLYSRTLQICEHIFSINWTRGISLGIQICCICKWGCDLAMSFGCVVWTINDQDVVLGVASFLFGVLCTKWFKIQMSGEH